ncbi:MAG TPA: Spy/CpxP family protein refolding chaperone [Thermoanaerobaculia bacterium]|nr:Spy/CpxP family protein refolding chaperone [Thermoanaerobaculia bacterium]
MKKNSKWMSAVAVVALSASLAVAAPNDGQRGPDGGGGRHHDGAPLAEKLNLSAEQKQQWDGMRKDFREQNASFLESFHQTRKELREAREAGDTAKADSLKPALESQREQMKQLRQAQEQKFVSILNADQRAQFDKMKADREERRRQHEERCGNR